MEVPAAGWSFLFGISTAYIASRLIVAKLESIELLEACAKMSVLLFLWCNLYFSIKHSRRIDQERERLLRAGAQATDHSSTACAARFTVRTGSRIHIVPAEDIAWISAAGDYVELHTRNATHLLRETMYSLGQRLDQNRFARIHRSKIINLARILELRSIENREYIVKLCDGSQHRSSRTYADQLERWLHSGRPEK